MRKPLLTMTLALLVSNGALAGSAHEDAIEYRHNLMEMLKHNARVLGGMANGKVAYDAKRFASASADLNALAHMDLLSAFPEGSDEGDTEAKADIWFNMNDFTAKLGDFRGAAAKLDEQAQAGAGLDVLGPAFAEVGKACKACHKAYKE
jgi:cytochrome c556